MWKEKTLTYIKNPEFFVPVIHFLLTFVWERSVFIFSDNWEGWITEVKEAVVSGDAELTISYITFKIFAAKSSKSSIDLSILSAL